MERRRKVKPEANRIRALRGSVDKAMFAAILCFALGLPFVGGDCAWASIAGDENIVDPTQRADNSFIYDTTVASLYDQASLYNDRTVQVIGEVIGDRIQANNPWNYWVTLTETVKEDKSTISVLMSADQTKQIDRYGRYGVVGTRLQVRGTYHQACDEHDGLPDIHATASSVLERGYDMPSTMEPKEFLPGLIALILGFALMGVYYYIRERNR